MADKVNRVRMAQIVAYANFPELKRFPAENHIAVKKELRRNFGNLKERYVQAVQRLHEEQRVCPVEMPVLNGLLPMAA